MRPIGKQTLPKILGAIGGIFRVPLTPPTTGVYFLVYRGRVVYVGQARSIPVRIAAHVTDCVKTFDSAYAIPVTRFKLNDVERAFITLIQPKYNGRFPGGRLMYELEVNWAVEIVSELLASQSSPIPSPAAKQSGGVASPPAANRAGSGEGE